MGWSRPHPGHFTTGVNLAECRSGRVRKPRTHRDSVTGPLYRLSYRGPRMTSYRAQSVDAGTVCARCVLETDAPVGLPNSTQVCDLVLSTSEDGGNPYLANGLLDRFITHLNHWALVVCRAADRTSYLLTYLLHVAESFFRS